MYSFDLLESFLEYLVMVDQNYLTDKYRFQVTTFATESETAMHIELTKII